MSGWFQLGSLQDSVLGVKFDGSCGFGKSQKERDKLTEDDCPGQTIMGLEIDPNGGREKRRTQISYLPLHACTPLAFYFGFYNSVCE